MNSDVFIVPASERPSWLEYPQSFRRIVEQSLIHLVPWHILECRQAPVLFRGLAERYPSRELFPFAYRQDNDDLACWAKDMDEMVFIIHDFAAAGRHTAGAHHTGGR